MEATRTAHDGTHEQPDAVQREVKRVKAKEAEEQAANGARGRNFGATLKARFDVSKIPRPPEVEQKRVSQLVARIDRKYTYLRKLILVWNDAQDDQPECPVKIKEEQDIMSGKRNPLPPVHILADTWMEPTLPNGNGKPPVFDELNGVALGIWDFGKPESRKRMMEEAAGLLDRGFVPGPGFALENDKAGVMLFDSHRYRQLRPALTPRERAGERFDLWQQDQLAFGEVVAAEVRPAAEAAIS